MTYSRYFLPNQKKIPVPITIAIVILIIFFIARFFTETSFPSRADKKSVRALTLANLAHNQAAIFWQTDRQETGWIIYGTSEKDLKLTASDERDLQNKKNTFYNHFVVLKNLQPDTTYFYKIVSNDELVEAKQETPFSFKTSAANPSVSSLNPAYGKVIRENGEALVNAIVFISIDKSFPLITLSKATGEWLMPLNPIINKDTLKSQQLGSGENLTVDIFSEDNKKSSIKTTVAKISPLPQTVIIGQNFNFLNDEEVLSATAKNNATLRKIDILFPKNAAVIPGERPLIKGTAIAGNPVEVTLDAGEKYTFKTVADKDGLWSVITKEVLQPGSHTLTVISRDSNNKSVQLTRRFSIAKSGEQVLAAATPDATFTPTDIPPTEIPTIFISPTVYLTPIVSESPTIVISPPVSGINMLPLSIASATLIILGLGIFLAF